MVCGYISCCIFVFNAESDAAFCCCIHCQVINNSQTPVCLFEWSCQKLHNIYTYLNLLPPAVAVTVAAAYDMHHCNSCLNAQKCHKLLSYVQLWPSLSDGTTSSSAAAFVFASFANTPEFNSRCFLNIRHRNITSSLSSRMHFTLKKKN